MKRIVYLFMLGICLCISCGTEDEADTPEGTNVKPETGTKKPAGTVNQRTVRFEDQITSIRNAKSKDEKVRNIYRLNRVPEKDYPVTIAYLTDILNSNANIFERTAAASSLINIGTKEALAPVKISLVFKAPPGLKMGIVKKLQNKSPDSFRKDITAWSAELLKDEKLYKTYSEIAGI